MHKPLLTAAALLTLAAPAYAQVLTGDRAISYGGLTIPATQAQSPAGRNEIAFRPACSQLVPVTTTTAQVDWTIQMPDGQVITLYTLDNLPESQAHLELQAAGLCKFGTQADGVANVPIIYTQDLPVEVVAQPTAASTGVVDPAAVVGPPNSLRSLLLMGIAAAGLGGVAYAFMRSQDKSEAPPKPSQSNDNDPFGHI